MGRGKERNDGGQRRTIHCGCGWTHCGIPDRILKIVTLHAKKCEIIDLESFRTMPNKRIFDNAYSQTTAKATVYKGMQFIDGMPTSIDFTKNKLAEQIEVNYQNICKRQQE